MTSSFRRDRGLPSPEDAKPEPPASEPEPAEEPSAPAEPAGYVRQNDPGIGRASRAPVASSGLTDDDRAKIADLEADEAAADQAAIDAALQTPPLGLPMPRLLRGSVALAVFLGGAALLLLFVLSQVATALSLLNGLPLVGRVLFGAAFVLLGIAVLCAVVRLALFFVRLRRTEQIALSGFEQLREREQTRGQTLRRSAIKQATGRLETYLRGYDIDAALAGDRLQDELLDDTGRANLAASRDRLLDADLRGSNDAWLQSFQDAFQAPLDAAAMRRINLHAKRVGVRTAVSPNALLDLVITFYGCFVLIGDLCRIYNVRLGRTQTAVLLGWVFFNAYVAGQSDVLESAAEEQITGLVDPDAITGLLAGKLGARAASGALNGLLVRRLGKTTAGLLRPVAAK